jgi:hypothetical protein
MPGARRVFVPSLLAVVGVRTRGNEGERRLVWLRCVSRWQCPRQSPSLDNQYAFLGLGLVLEHAV